MSFANKIKNFNQIFGYYDHFIFDFNGVLWYGPTKYKDAFDTLHYLRSLNKDIFFITNCSSDTRQQYTDYLMKAGFETSQENVYPVTYFAPAYLKMRFPDLTKVYIIGREGFVKEARDAGLEVISGIGHDHLVLKDEKEFEKMYVDDEIKAVLVGEDIYFNFYKLAYASVCIQQNGAKFFSCTDDPFDFNGVRNLPSCGAILKAIEVSSNQQCHILGKPNRHALDLIISKNKLEKRRCLMIGDRLNADIVMANNAEVDSCLVLTGVTTQEVLYEEFNKPYPIKPTHICWNLELKNSRRDLMSF